jgi:hypothetical protein
MQRYYATFNQNYDVDDLIDIDVRAIVAFGEVALGAGDVLKTYTRVYLEGQFNCIDLACNKLAVIAAIDRAFEEEEAATHEVTR